MKKYLWVVIGLSLFTGLSCQVAIDVENETEAIKTVIEEETQAFLNKDFDRMAATYVKDETNIRLSSSSSSYDLIVGWDKVEPLFKEYFENNPEPSTDRYVKDNYKIVYISVVNTSSYEE